MKSEAIRDLKRATGPGRNFAGATEAQVVCFWLAEIAAQLAELNERNEREDDRAFRDRTAG